MVFLEEISVYDLIGNTLYIIYIIISPHQYLSWRFIRKSSQDLCSSNKETKEYYIFLYFRIDIYCFPFMIGNSLSSYVSVVESNIISSILKYNLSWISLMLFQQFILNMLYINFWNLSFQKLGAFVYVFVFGGSFPRLHYPVTSYSSIIHSMFLSN